MSKMKALRLEEIADQLQMVNDESDIFYNTEAGGFVYYSADFPDNEIDPDDLEDEKYIVLPSQRDIGEYEIMSDFADSVRDSHKRELLHTALEGKGAFRRFKDTVARAELQDQWYAFRDQAFLRIAKEWCEENNLPFQKCAALNDQNTEGTPEKTKAGYAAPSVNLVTLESRNHIVGDIERGVKILNQGGIEFEEREPGFYWVRVPHKGSFKMVTVNFSRDGQDVEQFSCHCTLDDRDPPVCRHVVAAVLAIQGGIAESKLELGKTYWFESIVTEKDTASAMGSGNLEVLATPKLVALMEHAAYTLLEEMLEEGQTSVGTSINITHTAASPIGVPVEIEAKITLVKGRVITFEVSASDEFSEIGKGTHTRVIVNRERFLEKAKRRKPME